MHRREVPETRVADFLFLLVFYSFGSLDRVTWRRECLRYQRSSVAARIAGRRIRSRKCRNSLATIEERSR